MKSLTNRKDRALILAIFISFVVVAAIGNRLSRGFGTLLIFVIFATISIYATIEIYRRLSHALLKHFEAENESRSADYRQVESLLSILFTIKPELPLPPTRGWAASPDLLKKIVEVILVEKPDFVIEAGSGVSTIVIGYCLKKLGKGKVVSLEHNPQYATNTQTLISAHGLSERAFILHAPLKEFNINGAKWLWYDMDSLSLDQPIDLLIIDGPPGNIQKLSRYPSLPLLVNHLSDTSKIILDDGRREDEKQIVALWEKEFRNISADFLDTDRGAYLITKSVSTDSSIS